jgi:glycine/D-amino acid oxidase-like deaminating enzyme
MSSNSDQSSMSAAAKRPTSVDIVIIGAGIIGISTAWFLSKRGYKVVVCEKGKIAGEQSSKNWGWIRQMGRDEAELPVMMESIRIWEELSADIGSDLGFRREGSLYLCENEEDVSRHDRFRSFAPAYGLESQLLSPQQLYGILHHTSRQWTAALHTPSDGRAEPAIAVPAIARACKTRGVSILENCAVRSISTANQEIDGVHTELGFIKCSSVVCCGGAWTSSFLYNCGVHMPQLTVKASVVRTAPAPLIFAGNASGSRLAFRRREDGGYTLAMGDYLEVFPSLQSLRQFKVFLPLLRSSYKKLNFRLGGNSQEQFYGKRTWQAEEISPFENNRALSPVPAVKTIQRLRSILARQLPVLKDIEIVESWAGMIDATPDVVPVMDKVSDINGLHIASGFSGHGFGIGPAAGKIMASLVENKGVEYDLSRFRLSRFSDGSTLKLGPLI